MSLRLGPLAVLCVWAVAPAADPPAVLHLADGGHLPGALVGSDAPEVWRWRSPLFTRPVEFPAAVVRGVHYAMPAAPPKPAGEFCVELAGEDVVYGDLATLSDTEVELTGTTVGRLRLKREHVRRIYRWMGNDTVYSWPNGLTGWTAPAGSPRWREEGGQLVTDQPGAALFADLGLPDRAVVEVGLSWKGPPDFTLALGTDDRDGAARQGFRFEVWDSQLVVVGESPRDADVAVVQPAAADGSVRVQIVLDQTQRRLTLLSRAGKPLATLALDPVRAEPRRGVRVANNKGDLRVEHLRVAQWTGPPPRDIRDDQPRVGRTDGSVVYGRVTGYDPAAKRFTVREGDRETPVPADAVADVYLVAPAAPAPADAGWDRRSLRVALRDGTRVSGRPDKIEDTHLTLACPGVREPLRLPLADVRSFIPLRSANAAEPPEGRPGRLEADGVRLPGRLVGDGTRLVWHPDLGRTAGELVPGFAGRIVYRDPPPPPPPVPQAQILQNRRVVIAQGGAMIVEGRPVNPPVAPAPAASGRRSLHLRTGDAVPCEVLRIDERGVTLKSPQTAVTFVPHEKVKSVELVPTRAAPALDEVKRDRLLMLPRSQKDTPPTHLICARTGDFLRGRLVAMDDAKLTVEVRLETKEIPRDRVAQIIWLHPEELAAAPAPRPDVGAKVTRAQTVAADGNRLTFAVAGSDGRTITGTSDVLGGCRVALADVDQVLFGDAIERSAAELAYHRWKLRHAPEPKFVTAGDDGTAGADSPLVGQPAPPLRLPLLDGKPYNLADRKGKVVVLEFWATWCGPCLQTMPLVEAVTREFAGKGVELLAVNLEEPQDKVKATLDRQKLAVPVALDRDGVAAGRYAVTSIPQVVVIDRDGKVARLYVGGGKETADQLRAALQALTDK